MKQQHADYQLVPYPKMRRATAALLRSFKRKPMMHGMIEVDVTTAREFLREHKARTGESLSFTAFIIGCVGKAVDEHKAVQAYRQGWKHLVVFDDMRRRRSLTFIRRRSLEHVATCAKFAWSANVE